MPVKEQFLATFTLGSQSQILDYCKTFSLRSGSSSFIAMILTIVLFICPAQYWKNNFNPRAHVCLSWKFSVIISSVFHTPFTSTGTLIRQRLESFRLSSMYLDHSFIHILKISLSSMFWSRWFSLYS